MASSSASTDITFDGRTGFGHDCNFQVSPAVDSGFISMPPRSAGLLPDVTAINAAIALSPTEPDPPQGQGT